MKLWIFYIASSSDIPITQDIMEEDDHIPAELISVCTTEEQKDRTMEEMWNKGFKLQSENCYVDANDQELYIIETESDKILEGILM